ncbi:hypothetical protein CWE09_04525 [Aliidiomarina minuta]|uniref:Uncharacterized protein n=1 Tax=Aliidiomarina minuta TaxID=880057 RepID=A0A432W7R7_9GAMM|nr:hypothetical protein CWE09_04525 [Aliidiomarina minuta]
MEIKQVMEATRATAMINNLLPTSASGIETDASSTPVFGPLSPENGGRDLRKPSMAFALQVAGCADEPKRSRRFGEPDTRSASKPKPQIKRAPAWVPFLIWWSWRDLN